ncbi:MAG TPA: cytochrome c biogenesis protein CcdA [Armatimonadota bacterium]
MWGLLSILLSPCHLSSIPLIVGFISSDALDEQATGARMVAPRRALLLSSLFAVGILLTIALVGLVTAQLGRMMGDVGKTGNYLVAGILLIVGLNLLDLLPLRWPGSVGPRVIGRGGLAVFLLGLLFAIALGPCTFAYLAPILAVVFRVAATQTAYAVALLLAYGAGHCSVIVLAGTSAEGVERYLSSRGLARGSRALKRACGLLVILGGVYLVRSVG